MSITRKQKGIAFISLLVILGMGIGIYNYIQYLKQYEVGIQEPIENGLPFEIVNFNTSEGLTFHKSNGTHIEIPANAIVDRNGNEVSGPVEFRFREMHKASDIFLSGIPMQMNEDRTKHLQSMGMVELRVFKGSEELALKEGKEIGIDVATEKKPDDNYDLWYLNKDENWEQNGVFKTVNNDRRDLALSNLPSLNKPKKPVEEILFQLASDKNMPHLKVWNGVDWRLSGGQDYKKLYRAMRINWDKIDIKLINKRNKFYRISFSAKKKDHKGNIFSESISVSATPNVNKKDMKKLLAQYEEDLDSFAEVLKNREIEEDRLLEESAMLNSFSSNGFGIYNIDKLEETKILAKIDATFDFEDDLNAKINKVKLIMICSNQSTVLTYNAFDWDELPLIDDEVELVAALPNGTFAYVSSEIFKAKVQVKNISPYFENKRHFNTTKLSSEKLKALMIGKNESS
ncbi:hypothetical protein N9O13_05980 [Crocinitomicaceae bacterium]|nr:hypothetical protein [Crocinitomicaceae bacterium]